MRAMTLFENSDIDAQPLQMVDAPDPQPGAGEIRLKVRCCGICRTDLHVIEGDLPREKRPIVPGHQIVGIVEALGAGSSRFEIGQRVGVAWLRHTCGACEWCRAGRVPRAERALGDREHPGRRTQSPG